VTPQKGQEERTCEVKGEVKVWSLMATVQVEEMLMTMDDE